MTAAPSHNRQNVKVMAGTVAIFTMTLLKPHPTTATPTASTPRRACRAAREREAMAPIVTGTRPTPAGRMAQNGPVQAKRRVGSWTRHHRGRMDETVRMILRQKESLAMQVVLEAFQRYVLPGEIASEDRCTRRNQARHQVGGHRIGHAVGNGR